jgi:hypothetical protein
VELPARGEPLEAIFHDWNVKSVLTEKLRWRLLALFLALEGLWKIMFRLVVFDSSMFVYDEDADKMVLVFAGLGRLCQPDAMVANRAPCVGPTFMTRRSTSFCSETGETVDTKYHEALKDQEAALLNAGEDWGVDSDEVVERELLPIHLSRAKAKLAGKTVGFPRVPTKEAFLDDELRDGVFGKEVAFKEVLGEAKQADFHQVLLWVASKISKRQWSSRFKTGLQPLLELGDDDAIVCILEQCFQADKPQTRCCSQQPAWLQPAARRRFAHLLAVGLR